MPNFITIKDGNNLNTKLHTIEDSTSTHFNQSITTDPAGNTVTIVSDSQAVTSTMSGLVVIHRGPITVAGTVSVADKVSIAGAVAQAGTWTVQPGNTANTTPWLVSVNGTPAVSIAAGRVSIQGISQVSVAGLVTVDAKSNTGAAVPAGAFYVGGVDGGGLLRGLLTDTSGRLVVNVSNQFTVSVADKVSIAGAVAQSGIWNVGLNAGTNIIGKVSIADSIVRVSVEGTLTATGGTMTQTVGAAVTNQGYPMLGSDGANATRVLTDTGGRIVANVSNIVTVSVADKVSVAGTVGQSGTWTVQPGNIQNTTPWLVSVADKVSIAGAVAQSGTWNVGLNAGTNVIGKVSIADSIVRVSLEGSITATGGTMTQTVGAAVTTEGFPMLGSDGSLARRILTTTGGALIVHVSNTAPGGGGGGGSAMTQTVGAAVTVEGYPMLGSDGTNARRLLTTGTGSLIVHVSNATQQTTVSIGGPVSTQAVQIAGTDSSNNARTIKTNVSGVTIVTGRMFSSQDIFTRPNDVTAYTGGTTAAPGAAGDLVANSTTNTAVKPLKFRVAQGPGQMAYIRSARLYRTGGTAAAGQHNIAGAIRLHIFNSNNGVSTAVGDNSPMLASPVSDYLGFIDLLPVASAPGLRTTAGVTVQVYQAAPTRTTEIMIPLSATQVSVQGLLETRIAFTPIANEIFTVQIDGFNS